MSTKKKTVKAKPVTLVAFVLDKSSSMGSLSYQVRDLYNEMLSKQQGRSDQDIYLSLLTFSDQVEVKSYPTKVDGVKPLNDFRTGGNTALFDAVGKAVEVLRDTPGSKYPETSFLVIVLTDGEENESRTYSAVSIRALIKSLETEGNWTLAFNLPQRAKAKFVRTFGIPAENVREWEATTEGVRETAVHTQSAFDGYFAARSMGLRSVDTFYSPVDVSKLKTKDVAKALDDLSSQFKAYAVSREESIKEFVETKTRKPYVTGSTYYQLTKRELVQPTKSILLREKGKTQIWGGKEARELIGLPTDGVAKAQVDPVNLSKWEIFVKSTSVNRRLVRGTTVLVDKNKVKADAPTWGKPSVI